MNILQVTPGYYPVIGGVERHVQALAERLVQRGHRVTVATFEPSGATLGSGRERGVDVARFPSRGAGDAYRLPVGMAAFIRERRNSYDIVHVHNYHAPLIPLVALSGARPFAVTTHLNDAPHSALARLLHYPYRLPGGWAVRRAAVVVCVTEAERDRVTERLRVPRARTVVIPNGFDAGLLAARGGDRPARDPFLLLTVGRLQAYKRVDAALAGLARLDQRFRLAVVGDGPERARLADLAAALGLAARVTFFGRASDAELVDWYGRAGVVLALSAAEAFGMTVLEAVAAGAQVVASEIPAFADLARTFPGQVALVDPGAPERVAAAARAAAGRVGGTPADVSAFTWDAVTDRLVEVYRGVTERARGERVGPVGARTQREDRRQVSNAESGAEQGGP